VPENNGPTSGWTETRIQHFIDDGIEGTLVLGYKACGALAKTDSKKSKISKDISALANSEGGTPIYVVVESGHKPEKLDAGVDPREITKEWLEQVITGTFDRASTTRE
jgi:hypothetical protein